MATCNFFKSLFFFFKKATLQARLDHDAPSYTMSVIHTVFLQRAYQLMKGSSQAQRFEVR